MPDFLSYTMHQRDERVIHGDVVALSADRWQRLVDFIAANYGDANVAPEIPVYEPTEVNGIMFLPARYRGPDDAWPLTIDTPQSTGPAPAVYYPA